MNKVAMKDEVIAANIVLHVSCGLQYEAPSSKQNSTPPSGDPKAAAIPAAAPQAMKSRFSLSFRNARNLEKLVSNPNVVDLPCDSPAPHIAPQ
mmetsp:Transcript_19543/g.36800  ORF Transcript_19543/g.36800 Transcript_19543/m.36800 type:complete len:93 (-) Transcript_19543:177-455(-)